MRILWVDGYGARIGSRQGAIYVRDGENETLIPTSDVDVVVVASGGVSISSQALRRMLGAGIELVVLDPRGMPVGTLFLSYYTRTPTTRRAQYEAYMSDHATRIIWSIVEGKLWNQACAIRELYSGQRFLRETEERIKGVITASESERKALDGLDEVRRRAMRVEAWGAREYWGAISRLLPARLGFTGRDNTAGDPVNAALNYGYGILYSLAFRELALAGLDPYAGFLHVDRSGRPVLVYDFVELFRALAVDLPLIKLFLKGWKPELREGLLSHESRRKIASEIVDRLRKRRIEQAMRSSALSLARSLRERRDWRPWRGCRS